MTRATLFVIGMLVMFMPVRAGAHPTVRVDYVHPERYTDANLHAGFGAEALGGTLDEMQQIFERLARKYLGPGEMLEVHILDIDLAGRFEPWRPTGSDVRIMRDEDWPAVTLRYALRKDGRVQRQNQEVIADRGYLMRPNVGTAGDPLRHEKAMLEDWFRERFADADSGNG